MENPSPTFVKSDAEWLEQLGEESYHVLREAGTERPYTGEFWDNHEAGEYVCKGCGELLFTSNEKFDSGCGWPSFYESVDKSKVIERVDRSHGMSRIEVLCAACHGHLGHVFPDGPPPTGSRYCINSASLGFRRQA
jgi:peptide-methionine (R)-S-oxide reductase